VALVDLPFVACQPLNRAATEVTNASILAVVFTFNVPSCAGLAFAFVSRKRVTPTFA